MTTSPLILVVEDEKVVRELIGMVLKRAGFRSLLARSGEEARELFHRHAADVRALVIDVSLPGINGLELLADLQRRWPVIPSLVMSGHTAENLADELAPLFVSGFLEKPFALSRLVEMVRQVLAPAKTGAA